MSPPAKKRKKPTSTKKKKPTTLTSLPDDLLLNCLARVSRLYYPTLSLVSKSFQSLLASTELYKTRKLLTHTESCLYVCLRGQSRFSWFTLCRKPDENLTNEDTGKKKKSSGYVLARVPIPHSPHPYFRGLVAVGSSIYNIDLFEPSRVGVLDCRSHTWHQAPSMRVKLMPFSASVLDRKIYVAGYIKDGDSSSCKNSIEVFDTKTQIWDPEPIPCSKILRGDFYKKTACIDGKFHVVHTHDQEVVAYNYEKGRWDMVKHQRMGEFMRSGSHCEIENVLYSAYDETIRWYDTKVIKWRKLKGLVGVLPKFPHQMYDTCVRLADYGGKMAVLWNERSNRRRHCNIFRMMCAVIALERVEKHKSCEIWGKVEWFDDVLTIPSHNLLKVLSVTV